MSALLFRFIFLMVARIGEATHPGPNPKIGVANPCGALHKAHLFQDVSDETVPTVWGISESHLTSEGVQRFRQELKFQSQQWKYLPGAPAPPLTSAPGCIGGKASGVGFLTNCPTRALPNDWSTETWESARLQACAVRIQQQWIKIGVAYGFAKQYHTRATREATDQILENLTEKIVFQSKGFRIICGDFNQDDQDALEQFTIWRNHGFVEIQDIAAQQWGYQVKPTCHQKTRKDHMWLSPELIPRLVDVTVDSTVFPDHATVVGEFLAFGAATPIPMWRKPMPIPWEEVALDHLDEDELFHEGTQAQITCIFKALEDTVDTNLRHQGKPGLLAQQRGRCQTTEATTCKQAVTPCKRSRKGEVQITYMGEHFTHTKWVRQLRRLQSLAALMHSRSEEPHISKDRTDLWNAIKNASGFPGGFAQVWKNRVNISHKAPLHLPRRLPEVDIVDAIFHDFRQEFQQLEKALIHARCQKAKENRNNDLNAIYRDVAKPRSLPVSTVVINTNAIVSDVSADGLIVQYQPPELDPHQPVTSDRGPLAIAHHEKGQITLEAPQNIEPGDHLRQPKLLGDLPDVFKAFQDLWEPMWNKHENTPIEQWYPILQQIQNEVPTPSEPFDMQPITMDQWRHAIKSKPDRSAVGPDGIHKKDLLHMPKALTQKLVDCINHLEQTSTPWPRSTMVGLIAAIEKHSAAKSPSEYRPITVLSMIYRTYSSIRTKQILRWIKQYAPEGLMGNMPNMSTTQVWRSLAEQIEHAHYFEYEWSGTVTDVCKCFNTLPRHVVYYCARHLGLPEFFTKSWMRNVSQIQRRFVVQGSCSPATWSTTGFPEGDPLSVLSMVLVNFAMHAIVTSKVSPIAVVSYVDNWEAQSSSAQATCEAFQAMDSFASALDIRLDKPKTHCWATTTQSRKHLKADGHTVLLQAKDLGGHLNYSKRRSNYSLRARITNTKPLWGWISRSKAPTYQKLRILYTVAWPRCLHGIAAVDVGIDHFTTMRAAAMNALRWEKHGSSSIIQFGLFNEPRHDPWYYAIHTTVMQFRQYCRVEVAFAVLDHLSNDPPVRHAPGPSGVLLARLHAIHWRWEQDGFIQDHQGFKFSLMDCPIQLLQLRLDHAWGAMVGHSMSSRAEFGGLGDIDVACSTHTFHTFSITEIALLRVAMNGSFYTRDKQFSSGKFVSKQCPWCNEQDSVFHRTWECPHFAHERSLMPPCHREYIMQQPQCTYLHGWFVESAEDKHYRAMLQTIPDTTREFEQPSYLPEVMHMFTDGSGIFPQHKSLRLVSWSVCLATFQDVEFTPLAAGGVPGMLQTVLRAELTAAIAACRAAIKFQRPFYIWTDCQLVFDRINQYASMKRDAPTSKQKDHDLWGQLQAALHVCCKTNLFQKVLKITSHVGDTQFSHLVDSWAARGNTAADTMASKAIALLPARVRQAHRRLANLLESRYAACQAMHKLFVAIGKKVVKEKEEMKARETEAWENVGPSAPTISDVISFLPLPSTVVEPEDHQLGEGFPLIHQWLLEFTGDEQSIPMWLSSYQLYAHFQWSTGHLGFHYNRKTKKFETLTSLGTAKEYNFIRAAGWFNAMLKSFAKAMKLPCNIQSRLPWGPVFKCWQRCLLVKASPNTMDRVHSLFLLRGTRAVQKVHTALVQYEPFRPGAS